MPTPFQVVVHPRIPSLYDPNRFLQAYQRGDPDAPNALIFFGGLTSGPHTTDLDFLTYVFTKKIPKDGLLALGTPHPQRLHRLRPLLPRQRRRGRLRPGPVPKNNNKHTNRKDRPHGLINRYPLAPHPTLVPPSNPPPLAGSQACLVHAKITPQLSPSAVDGYILTSPVSDREFASLIMAPDTLTESLNLARQMVVDGEGGDSMPCALMPVVFAEVPVSAYRWWELADVA